MKYLLIFLFGLGFIQLMQGNTQPRIYSPANYSGYSQTTMHDSVAVILSDANVASGKRGSCTAALKSMSGVNFISYCSNHAAYLLYIDIKAYGSKASFLSSVIQTTGLSDLYIKNSGDPMELLNKCEISDAATQESIKTKYGK